MALAAEWRQRAAGWLPVGSRAKFKMLKRKRRLAAKQTQEEVATAPEVRSRRRRRRGRSRSSKSACRREVTMARARPQAGGRADWRRRLRACALLLVIWTLLEPSADQQRPHLRLAAADPNANRLYEDLMMTYNRLVRPVNNETDRVLVRFGLKLSQLMEVNLKNQMMTIYVWVNQEWYDTKLKWDPKEYDGLEHINLPADQIWFPDIALYNSAEGSFTVSTMTKAKVYYDGKVIWNPPAIFRSSCQIDITYFPFDSQSCKLKFGSWTYGAKIDLRHQNDTDGVIERGTDLSEYYQNVEWDLMRAIAERNVITYTCCPNDEYIDLTFTLTLRRKPLFYTVNLILPCVGITFSSFLVFYLPSDSGEKVTLTISILVSLIFFLSVLIETIPSTSLAMPLLGKYLVFIMILITLSVCATVCVLNLHFRTPSTHSMPPWIKRWCMDILPKYLFMSVPQYQSQTAGILPEQLVYLHNQAYATNAVTLPLDPSQTPEAQPLQPTEASSRPQANYLASRDQHQKLKLLTLYNQFVISSDKTTGQKSAQPEDRSLKQQPPIMMMNSQAISTIAQQNNSASNHLHQHQSMSTSTSTAVSGQQPPPMASTSLLLPYLQSEAARRLQLQRSRSSERDNKSTSDIHQQSNASSHSFCDINSHGGRPSSRHGRTRDQHRQNSSRESTSQNYGHHKLTIDEQSESKRKRNKEQKSTKKSASSSWRLLRFFRLSSSSTSSSSSYSSSSSSAGRENLELRKRSSSASSPLASHIKTNLEHRNSSLMDDSGDEYQHHRHFQARASICSNNLWRIGPTRRCSLAVAQANYPSFYRPQASCQLYTVANQPKQPELGEMQRRNLAVPHHLQPQHHFHFVPSNPRRSMAINDESLGDSTADDSSVMFNEPHAAIGALVRATNVLVRPTSNLDARQRHVLRPTQQPTHQQVAATTVRLPPNQFEATPATVVHLRPGSSVSRFMPPPPPPLPPDDRELVLNASNLGMINRNLAAHESRPMIQKMDLTSQQQLQNRQNAINATMVMIPKSRSFYDYKSGHLTEINQYVGQQPNLLLFQPSVSQHSIGRAIGQVYTQRLQRQPALSSIQPSGSQCYQCCDQEIEAKMRRSKSQNALDRRFENLEDPFSRPTNAGSTLHLGGNTASGPKTLTQTPGCTRNQCAQEAPINIRRRHQSNGRNFATNMCSCAEGSRQTREAAQHQHTTNQRPPGGELSGLSLIKLIGDVDKAIQNAMFIAQHIDNLDEFESVKENWKYIAMVVDRIFLIIFMFACIAGTIAIFSLVPWSHYLIDKPLT